MIKPVYEAAKELQLGITVYHDEAKELLAGNGIDSYIEADAKACDITIRQVNDLVRAIDFPVNKLLLSGAPDKMKEVEKTLKERFGDKLNVFRSDPFYVEILPKFVDKSVAVDKLMKFLEINREKVICVGDSFNDLPMLRYAGKGVAMGNAQKEVKETADYVTATNDEDGIVEIIEKFMTPRAENDDGDAGENPVDNL